MGVTAQAQLLEREEELAVLAGLLERAREGEGRAVLLEGAAGIGKTRLLQAARDSAKEAGMQMLSARATELERDFPFALVHQLFEPALHALDQSERDKLLADTARPAAPLVGVGAGEASADAHGADADPTFATLNALYWLTSNLAESAPLLLAVDDVHWGDKASLRFLRFLIPRLEDLPVLLAVATRPSEPGGDPELLDQLAGDPLVHFLRPQALSKTAVAELVRSDLSSGAAEEFCAASHEVTAGNPFLLRELLVELNAQGSSGAAGEARELRGLAPATIQQAVLLRLARLPEEAGRLARAVAVLGDDAEPRQAGALAELDPQVTALSADALVTADILESGRPLRFAHPLVRNAVYADTPSAERTAAHRAAAKLLENHGAEPERIALHLLATDPRDDPGVVATLNQAAERALKRAAPEAAIAYVRRALAELPEQETRTNLLARLLVASTVSLDRGALEELPADAVEELTADPRQLMSSASELAPLLLTYGRVEEGTKILERAIDAAVAAADYDLVMRFEAQRIMWQHISPAKDVASWDRYEAVIEPDTPAERMWLSIRALSGTFGGAPAADVADLAGRAVADGTIFREHLDGVISSLPVYTLVRADELDVVERVVSAYGAEGQAHGAAFNSGAAFLRAELAFARGDVARAEPDARAAVESGRLGDFLVAFPNWSALLVDVLVELDELSAAEHQLRQDDLDGDLPDDAWFIPVLLSRARLRIAQGRSKQGIADVFFLAELGERQGVTNVALAPAIALAAIELARAGQDEPARRLADLYRAGAKVWGTARARGTSLHSLGVVEGGEGGIELLREAVATLEDSPARLEHAKALTDLGAALRRANRRAEAREPLRAALEMARPRGAVAVAKRAHEELEATGERLGRFAPVGVESLTPSERRIAALAAEGLTNRQIAQNLFLSVKTVESHLRGAYRKLDISSRGELAGALEPSEGPAAEGPPR